MTDQQSFEIEVCNLINDAREKGVQQYQLEKIVAKFYRSHGRAAPPELADICRPPS
jgi:hypothetical protein